MLDMGNVNKHHKPASFNHKSTDSWDFIDRVIHAAMYILTAVTISVTSCLGPLMGAPQCRVSISRNGNVACLCRLFSSMSHVAFMK